MSKPERTISEWAACVLGLIAAVFIVFVMALAYAVVNQ